jgi:hypothetical protein
VVTYLLGVGDRHLDNLLLAPDGKYLFLHPPILPDFSLQVIFSTVGDFDTMFLNPRSHILQSTLVIF